MRCEQKDSCMWSQKQIVCSLLGHLSVKGMGLLLASMSQPLGPHPRNSVHLPTNPRQTWKGNPSFFLCLPEGDWQCSPELASLIKELNSGPFTMYVILCGWKETWRRERKQALKPPEIGRQTSGMRLLQGSSPQIKPGTEIHLQVIRLKSGLGFIVSC